MSSRWTDTTRELVEQAIIRGIKLGWSAGGIASSVLHVVEEQEKKEQS